MSMSMSMSLRVGLIVPSSNTTMETEIPAMLRRHAFAQHESELLFTFHSSRMRMRQVSADELAPMDAESERCARELSDAHCDVLAYACLIAIMAAGPGYHVTAEQRLTGVAAESGCPSPVITSAGALLEGVRALGARRIALVAPYQLSLTRRMVDYLAESGIEVVDAISLEIEDNLRVGRLDPRSLLNVASGLRLADAEALVLSACVQMPSLQAIEPAEQQFGLPVLSAATATAWQLLSRLGLEPRLPGAGHLLAGSR